MIIIYYIFIALAALLLSILDTSYLSFLEVNGATVLSAYAVLIILALNGRRSSIIFYSALLTLFYSAFSSLPVLFLIFIFFATPLIIQFFKRKVVIESNFIAILFVFFVFNFLFEGILILISRDFSSSGINAWASFTLINVLFGMAIYYGLKLCARYFGIKK